MRPRQSSLGNPLRGCLCCATVAASMRPRQSSLGNGHPHPAAIAATAASMRPRQSSLGNPRPLDVFALTFRRFNEAEAIKPRKPWGASPAGDRTTRPASMRPRQSSLGNAKIRIYRTPLSYASMRPRQSSLGNGRTSTRNAGAAMASMRPRQSSLGNWNHKSSMGIENQCFNEAEAIKPRKRLLLPPPTGRNHASMRPRQSSLGNHLLQRNLFLLL